MSGMDILFANMLKALKINPDEMRTKFDELVSYANSINQRLGMIEEQQQQIIAQQSVMVTFIGSLARQASDAHDGSVPPLPAHFNGGGNGVAITTAEPDKGSISNE